MTRTPIAWCLPLALSACDPTPAEYRPYRALEVPEGLLDSADRRAEGRALFERHCVICHGPTGEGNGARHSDISAHPPNFTTPAWRKGVTPQYVHAVIQEGKRGTSMPAFRVLDRDETWSVVAYVLSLTPAPEEE